MSVFLYILKLLRPGNIFGTVLLFWLGAGIANYFGAPIDPGWYAVGQAWILVWLLGMQFLYDFFHPAALPASRSSTDGQKGISKKNTASPRALLLAGLSCLAVLSFLTVLVLSELGNTPLIGLFMAAIFGAGLWLAVPALRLEFSGYGELIMSVIAGYGIPAFAFIILTGELNRLLSLSTIPIVCFCLAMLIAFEIRSFAYDSTRDRHTLVVRMGWKSGMSFHQIMLISAFVTLLLSYLFGLPRFVLTASLLVVPIAGFQIYQIWQIGRGGPPNWNFLIPNAIATLGMAVYLFGFSYWIN